MASKTSIKTFHFHPGSYRAGEHLLCHPPVQTLFTPDGAIVIVQKVSPQGKWSLIPGIMVSVPRPYRTPHMFGTMLTVRVRPLSESQQQKYKKELRKKLRGPLNFW